MKDLKHYHRYRHSDFQEEKYIEIPLCWEKAKSTNKKAYEIMNKMNIEWYLEKLW